jgi:hypothetical protein
MLKRKMYDFLLEWKKSKKKECLLIKGARQVGKTFLVREFGKNEYESFIEINFQRQSNLKEIFDGELTAEEIYKRMTANIAGIKLIPGNTLILLDEIQKCANARTALKFLAEDNRFDIIATGSLLGLSYGQDDDGEVTEVPSIPVGYEHPVTMYSLDFEEFLWAYGYGKDAIDYLKTFFDTKTKVDAQTNEKYLNLVREFIVVGGMPEVVNDFVQYKDFGRVQKIQELIIANYEDDIAQHAKGVEKVKVRQCYDSIPRQLARENKKFKYAAVQAKATARKFGGSVQWICDANMANICYNVHEPALSLKLNEMEADYKLYLSDTGLLMAMAGFETKRALLNGTLKGNTKGGIYENFVAETLIKKGYTLHYYKPDDNREIEFIIEKFGQVIPVEVKAGNSSTVSLNEFIEKFNPVIAYKIIDGNVGQIDNKFSIPHYMAMFI